MQGNFLNPHAQYQALLLQQQQQMRQQQNAQMQPQLNPQVVMQMLQNNPQLAAMFTQQSNMMQQAPLNTQQNWPGVQQQNQRFGSGNEQMPQQNFQPQQRFEPEKDSRFAGPEVEEEEVGVVSTAICDYVVNKATVSIPLASKFTFMPKVTAYDPKLLTSIEGICFSYSLDDATDSLIKKATELEDSKLLYTIDSVVINDTFKTPFDPGYTKLFGDDIKSLYKRLRALYEEAVNIDTVIMLERVDKQMTEVINHYLKINFDNSLSIDRFSVDFNDLLKIIRSAYSDEDEDNLWEYLNSEVSEIYEILTKETVDSLEFNIIKPVTLVYFKEHHYKAGLAGVNGTMVKLIEEPTNAFLISTTKAISALTGRICFYMSTYDRNIFRFSVNTKSEVFVELIS